MGKSNVQISLVSNNSAQIIFGIAILFCGVDFFLFAKQIGPLLPGLLPGKHIWVYIIGISLFLAGIAIIINKQITTTACFLLSILLCALAVAIDLRGLLNSENELKYVFSEALIKNIALAAGAIIIANFEREKPRRHGKRRHRSSSPEKQNSTPIV